MVNIHSAEEPLQKQCPALEQKPEPYTMHGSGRNKQLNGRNEGKPPVGGSEHSLLTIGSQLLVDRPVFPLAVPIEIFVTYIFLYFVRRRQPFYKSEARYRTVHSISRTGTLRDVPPHRLCCLVRPVPLPIPMYCSAQTMFRPTYRDVRPAIYECF